MARQGRRAPTCVLFPELQLTGYPPEDLVLKPDFVRRTMEAAERLIDATAEPGPAIAVRLDHAARTGKVYNAVLLAEGGKLVARRLKHELPNYGTFDEKRVFAPGPLARAGRVARGQARHSDLRGYLAGGGVRRTSPRRGAEILLVPNGSPFEFDKDELRQQLVADRA